MAMDISGIVSGRKERACGYQIYHHVHLPDERLHCGAVGNIDLYMVVPSPRRSARGGELERAAAKLAPDRCSHETGPSKDSHMHGGNMCILEVGVT